MDPAGAFLSAYTKLNTFGLLTLTGAALWMYIFPITIIRAKPFAPSIVILRQFHHLIQLGAAYMQTASRGMAASLLINAILLYFSPDSEVSRRGVRALVATAILVQTAWFEIVFIFPTNDRLIEMKGELQGVLDDNQGTAEEEDKKVRPEILAKLDNWRKWHIGRIVLPALAGLVMLFGVTA